MNTIIVMWGYCAKVMSIVKCIRLKLNGEKRTTIGSCFTHLSDENAGMTYMDWMLSRRNVNLSAICQQNSFLVYFRRGFFRVFQSDFKILKIPKKTLWRHFNGISRHLNSFLNVFSRHLVTFASNLSRLAEILNPSGKKT